MKTTDLFKINRSSRRLKESFEKTFGKKLNLESMDLAKLEDARNKLRTQLSQIRSESNFNENLENDAYHQAQFILDAINSEIAEREEIIADAGQAEMSEEDDSQDPNLSKAYRMGNAAYKAGNKDALKTIPQQYKEMWVKGWEDGERFANESINKGNEMNKLRESEINQASTIVTAKTMVDRVGRWIEELSGMENDTLLQLGDSIRDEIGQAEAKQFITTVAPAIQQALENLKSTRETLTNAVHGLAGDEMDMLGAEPEADLDMEEPSEPDAMNSEPDLELDEPAADEFAAADAAAGGAEAAGRAKRESIEFENRLMKVLAG